MEIPGTYVLSGNKNMLILWLKLKPQNDLGKKNYVHLSPDNLNPLKLKTLDNTKQFSFLLTSLSIYLFAFADSNHIVRMRQIKTNS